MSTNLTDADTREELEEVLEETVLSEDYVEFLNTLIEILDKKTVVVADSESDLGAVQEGTLFSLSDGKGIHKINSEGDEIHMITSETGQRVFITEEGADDPTEEDGDMWFEYQTEDSDS
jgi:hypothetical protein